jgi:hypothetical protein
MSTKKKVRANKPKKKMMVKFETMHQVELGGLIQQAIEEYGVQPILKQMGGICLMYSAMAENPISGMLKSDKEIDKLCENSESAWVIMYVINHWNEMKEKGKTYYQELQKERGNG